MGPSLHNNLCALVHDDLNSPDGCKQDEQGHGSSMNIYSLSKSVSIVDGPDSCLLAAYPGYRHHQTMEKTLWICVLEDFHHTDIHGVFYLFE